jgi:chromosome segregation ATPase
MSEPIVYSGIGFVLALLLGLGIKLSLRTGLARRAMRRLETAAPSLMADIEADMDQLHGQIAVATRRLEMSVAQIKLRTTGQLAEIGRSSEVIARLKAEHGEQVAVVAALHTKLTALGGQLRATEAEFAVKTRALDELDQALATRKAELARFMAQYDVHPALAKVQKRHEEEIEVLRIDKAMVETQLVKAQQETARVQQEMAQLKRQVETTWASERMANAVLRERINDVASEVVRVAVALEGLGLPIESLTAGKPGGSPAAVGDPDARSSDGADSTLNAVGNGGDSPSPLADRIRSLRRRAAQASTER